MTPEQESIQCHRLRRTSRHGSPTTLGQLLTKAARAKPLRDCPQQTPPTTTTSTVFPLTSSNIPPHHHQPPPRLPLLCDIHVSYPVQSNLIGNPPSQCRPPPSSASPRAHHQSASSELPTLPDQESWRPSSLPRLLPPLSPLGESTASARLRNAPAQLWVMRRRPLRSSLPDMRRNSMLYRMSLNFR